MRLSVSPLFLEVAMLKECLPFILCYVAFILPAFFTTSPVNSELSVSFNFCKECKINKTKVKQFRIQKQFNPYLRLASYHSVQAPYSSMAANSQFFLYDNGAITNLTKDTNRRVSNSIQATYIRFSNVFAHISGYVLFNQTLYGPEGRCDYFKDQSSFDFIGGIEGEYDTVINLGDAYNCVFGHFFNDFIPFLELLPLEDVQRAHYVFQFEKPYMAMMLSVYGVKKDQIHTASNDDLFFAHEYIGLTRRHCIGHFPLLMKMFRDRATKIVKPFNGIPFKKVIFDRTDTTRNIYNILEVIEEFQSIPSYGVWEIIGDVYTLEEVVDLYSRISMYFFIHGSVYPNLIFLHKHSVVCEYDLKENCGGFMPTRSLAVSTNTQYVAVFDCSSSRHSKYVTLVIKRAIQCMKFGSNLLPKTDGDWNKE